MGKTLVACFSASGNTKKKAEEIAKVIDADFYEIVPKTLYSRADLNWMDKKSRSSVEMNDKKSRPELADKDANIDAYDKIVLGFPIWLAYHKLIQCTLGCQRVHFYDYPYSKNDRVHLPRIYGILW